MKLYFTFLGLLLFYCTSAQIQQVNNGTFNELVFYVSTNTTTFDDEVQGTRYLNDEFAPAKINSIEEVQFVRFNVVENHIELRDNNSKVLTLSKSYDYTIRLLDESGKQYETHSYIDDNGDTANSFFEKIHHSENYALYLKERIIYIPEKKAKSSYEQDIPGEFKKGNTVFYCTDFKRKSDTLLKIPKKRKNLSILFNERTKMVEKFIKKKGLNMSKKDDIIAMLEFFFEK